MNTTSYCLFVSKSNLQFSLPIANFRCQLVLINRQLAIKNRQSVKFAHRFQSAVPDDRSYRVGALFQNFGHDRSFAAWKRVEHKLLRVRDWMLRLNPDPQPQKLVRANRGDDRLEPVVSARRTTCADAYLSERQRKIIRNHDQLLDRRLALKLREQLIVISDDLALPLGTIR